MESNAVYIKIDSEEPDHQATSLENISSLIEITISCRELRKMDTLSLSDPLCRVFEFKRQT